MLNDLLVLTKNLRADNGLAEVKQTVELVTRGRLSGVVDDNVVALGVALDLIGELAATLCLSKSFLWQKTKNSC